MSEQQIPVLSEHQAPQLNTTNPSEYAPSDEERRALKMVDAIFQKNKKHRKKYDEHWSEYYKMFRGKQWTEQRPSYRHSEVINFIFQAIQSVVPIMTDARPRFEFLPEEPSDSELAKILSEVAQSDWEKNNWMMTLTEIIYDGHFYGTGLGSMEFDPKARKGAGGIVFESKDPFYCFPDPNARDVNVKARSFIYAEPVDVDLLKKEYPDKKQFIKPDLIDLMQGDKQDLDQVRFKSPTDTKTIMEGSSAYDQHGRDQALKITAYLYSDEFDEEELERDLPGGGKEKYYQQTLKWPNGRKICISGGVVLADGPIPYEDGLFPFARFVNYISPREFWGISEVEQLKSPQKIFNKLVSFALDVLTLMGNPVWKVGTGSGVDTDNLVNRPGLIIEADQIDQVQREPGVELQPYVLQLIDRMSQWFDGISGANDVTRGVRPEGITAASAISELQDSSQTRIRLKSRNLDALLQNLGQLWMSRNFQFRTAPEIVRLTANENAQKYFKFSIQPVEQPDGSVQKIARVIPYVQDETGNHVESTEVKEYPVKGSFDVRVTTGSSLPFAKSQKVNLAQMLFDRGAIDIQELLKATEWPNWEQVLQRIQEKQALDAQNAAAAAAAKAGGGMPGASGAATSAPPPAA